MHHLVVHCCLWSLQHTSDIFAPVHLSSLRGVQCSPKAAPRSGYQPVGVTAAPQQTPGHSSGGHVIWHRRYVPVHPGSSSSGWGSSTWIWLDIFLLLLFCLTASSARQSSRAPANLLPKGQICSRARPLGGTNREQRLQAVAVWPRLPSVGANMVGGEVWEKQLTSPQEFREEHKATLRGAPTFVTVMNIHK